MAEPMVCMNCGWMYDDAKEAKPFAQLDQSWVCPTCGCPTDLFEPLENSVWKTRPYGGSLHPENEGLQEAVRGAIAKDQEASKGVKTHAAESSETRSQESRKEEKK